MVHYSGNEHSVCVRGVIWVFWGVLGLGNNVVVPGCVPKAASFSLHIHTHTYYGLICIPPQLNDMLFHITAAF